MPRPAGGSRRLAREVARDVALERLQRAVLDDEREVGEAGEGGHLQRLCGEHARGGRVAAGRGLQAVDELVEAQLLESAADGLELAGAELDQAAALLDQVERLRRPASPESSRG